MKMKTEQYRKMVCRSNGKYRVTAVKHGKTSTVRTIRHLKLQKQKIAKRFVSSSGMKIQPTGHILKSKAIRLEKAVKTTVEAVTQEAEITAEVIHQQYQPRQQPRLRQQQP